MKILICMASVDPRRGGPSTAVRSLAAKLTEQGHSVTIVAHNDNVSSFVAEENTTYDILRFPLTSHIWQFSAEYFRWIRRNIQRFDAVLIHSLFLSHSFYVSAIARKNHIPYAIRPHGSLNVEDMARNRLQKLLYMSVIEKRNLKGASFIFCTSQREADEAVRFGNFRTEVIPLGVDANVISDRDPAFVDRNLVAFIGRLTGKKGIDIIIESIPLILAENPAAEFVIAGPDDEDLQAGFEALATKLGVSAALTFPGHLDATARNELLSKAGAFVLPSIDENFGIGVAEAMTAGVPVVITRGVSHASYVTEYGAGLISTRTPESFASKVSAILNLHETDFQSMSSNAQRLVRDKYSWSRSADQLVKSFSA
jgi:glycosyltransferase involved in cell wall biosynthesis